MGNLGEGGQMEYSDTTEAITNKLILTLNNSHQIAKNDPEERLICHSNNYASSFVDTFIFPCIGRSPHSLSLVDAEKGKA